MAFDIVGSLFGTDPQVQEFQRFSPQQQQLQDQMISALGPLLQQLQPGQSGKLSPLLKQRERAFREQTVPSLAERFTGVGGQRSSAFQSALGAAGAGHQQDLAALQMQGLQQLLGPLLQGSLQPSFERAMTPGRSGLLGTGLEALGQGAGAYLASGGNPTSGILQAISQLLAGRKQGQAQIGMAQQQPSSLAGQLGVGGYFQNALG